LNTELHLFIIWKNARHMTENILEDLKKKFQLLDVYEVNWSTEFFSSNMSRFYGVKLPPGKEYSKSNQHEFGPFLLCIIEDKSPKYDFVDNNGEKILVNVNMYDAKQTYRSWTGGGHNVHGSNTIDETEHDLALLLGKNLKDIAITLSKSWNGIIKKLNSDLTGAKGWESTFQLFYILNATVKYLVLRSFENISELNKSVATSDIDILTNKIKEIQFITNGKKVLEEKNQEFHSVVIANNEVLLHVGEQYYDPKWASDMLDRKVLSNYGFYVPNDEDYFYSLLYRALIQKPIIPDDYVERLVILYSKLKINNAGRESFSTYPPAVEILDEYMQKMEYKYMPKDYSVFFNSDIVDFTFTKREHHMFLEKLKTKNWQEASAEMYHPHKLWDYEMMVNQSRSDFLFLLDIKKDNLALVIGADLGQIILPLSRLCNVIAVENDPEKIEIMKIRAKQENRNNIEFVLSDFHDTKFEADKFDLVIIDDFENINSFGNKNKMINPSEVLDESYRILKSGCTIYFGALNKFGLQYILGENVDGLPDYVYLKNDISKEIFEAETGKKLKVLHYGKQEYTDMILKSGFKDVHFFGNIRDHRLPYAWVDLSTNQSSTFIAKNMYFFDGFDMSNKIISKYSEKLKYLYEIFSEKLPDLYSSYSIMAQK